MAKRKMIQHNLLKNAISAYFAAIEIHNKPNIAYRYETVSLLLMNAWELALKAYIRKHIKERSIFDASGHTVLFNKTLGYVSDHLNSKKLKSFVAVKANLQAIEGYRNNVAHFYSEDLLPCVFTLVARCALNFVEFIKVSFSKDIMLDEGLFILPLGFSLPFQPEDFLSKTSPAYTSSSEARRFIDSIVTVIESLKNDGIEDSIVLGFDVYLQNIKKPENSDLLMKITSNGSSSIKISTVKSIRISNDPNAQSMKMDDEVFLDIYPHTYDNVSKWCKENISYFKQGKVFHSVMKSIKRNPEYAAVRKLNPRSNSSAAQTFYASVALNEIKRQYEEQGAAQ